MSLREVIAAEIRAHGPIPFSRYMELCLYHPALGYYSRADEKFGKTGDFYTASDIHAVYGRLMARQFDEMWRILGAPEPLTIVELGAGRGLFAQDLLAWADKKFAGFASVLHYILLESSPVLRNVLAERFRERIERGAAELCGKLERLPHAGNAIIFANEFFDALPVERIDHRGMVRVSLDKQENLIEEFAEPSAEAYE